MKIYNWNKVLRKARCATLSRQ